MLRFIVQAVVTALGLWLAAQVDRRGRLFGHHDA